MPGPPPHLWCPAGFAESLKGSCGQLWICRGPCSAIRGLLGPHRLVLVDETTAGNLVKGSGWSGLNVPFPSWARSKD